MKNHPRSFRYWAVALVGGLLSISVGAQSTRPIDLDKARVVAHWTSERVAGAIPRDLVIDPRGLGYLRRPDRVLEPYGHQVAAMNATQVEAVPSPFGKPGGGAGDTTPPTISGMDPAAGTTIGTSYTFKAVVTDASGVKSVTFNVRKGTGTVQSFAATLGAGTDTWAITLQGFTDGDWSWYVVARDAAPKGGNTRISDTIAFKVNTGSGSGGGAGTVTNAQWPGTGAVQKAAGRLYFEMPANRQHTRWQGYVCSGSVANDGNPPNGRSVIITAAHCVYDDVNKAFARHVLFIPNQAGTTGTGTDVNCSNDPLGCWAPSFGVVDRNWTLRTFPDNVAWDYAFYVVRDSGAHSGTGASSDALDRAVAPMTVSFSAVSFSEGGASATSSDFTAALGYSYSEDPRFMYCAENMTTNGPDNWWLPSCGLSGGSSGGPWLQPISDGNGPVISVNSWGYTSQPGMAGPKLYQTSASCVFGSATTVSFDANSGTIVDCPQ